MPYSSVIDRPLRDRERERDWDGKRKRATPAWAVILIVLGSVLVLVSTGSYVLVRIGLATIGGAVQQENLLGTGGATAKTLDGPLNILLVGVDTRPNGDAGTHSDTIIIAHIPASHDKAYLISIPRDTNATLPAFPRTKFTGGSYKINAAFTFGSRDGGGSAGGFQLLTQTIKQEYGITFNAGAIVNFDGFTDIVRQLGGVDMYIDETTYSIHRGFRTGTGEPAAPYNIDPNSGVPICPKGITFDANPDKCALPGVKEVVYRKGNQHLDAEAALDFVRARDGLVGTDYARQRHQQQFIKAVIKGVYDKGLSDPFKLSTFVNSVGKAFVFDGNGTAITDWIFALKGISPTGLVTIKTNGGKYVHYDGPAPDSRQALSPTSLELLKAIREDAATTDKVGEFVAQHSDWLAK